MIIRTVIFLLFCSISLGAQENSGYQLKKKIPVDNRVFKIDVFGNIYYTKEDHTLVKYDLSSEEKIEYTNNFLGSVTSYDVSNPLKILLFYGDYNQIVFLNNQLSEIRSPVNLDELGVSYTTGVCVSHQGGFWIVNTAKGKIERYDEDLLKQQETGFYNFLAKEEDLFLKEKNKMLYCYTNGHLYSFDLFGNLYKKHPLKNVNNIQIINKNIYYFYEHSLYRYNTESYRREKVGLPRKNEWSFGRVSEDRNYYLLKKTTKEIFIFHKKE